MSPFGTFPGALRDAVRRILHRPLLSLLVLAALTFVLMSAALLTLAAWRSAPWEAPSWTQAQALVLASGAEGEADLAALRNALRAALPPGAAAATFDFIGRDAALRDLAQRKSLAGLGLADLRPNPLPDAFRVRFGAGTPPEQVEAAVAALGKVHGVDAVEFDAELYRRAALLGQLAVRGVALLAGLLGAALLLAAVVAATFWARTDEDELRVLHLLGADAADMVRPAALAAGLSLLCAALLAWWGVVALAAPLEVPLADLAQRLGLHWDPVPLPPWGLALACCALGAAGAGLAAALLRRAVQRRLARSLAGT